MTLLLLLSSEVLSGKENFALPASRRRTYTQGTAVKIWCDVMDADTKLPAPVDDITVSIAQPNIDDIDIRTFTAGDIDLDDVIAGRYWTVIDTTPSAGAWTYQFAVSGDGAVVAKARFHVRLAVSPIGI